MANVLLIAAKTAKLLLAYGAYAAVILVALLLIGTSRRKTKKEMRPQTVKSRCVKAKKYAEKILSSPYNGANTLLGASKLLRLNGYVSDAAWLAFQIVGAKKDIIFEGIANALDGLATRLVKESSDGYVPAEEFEADVKNAIESLDSTIEKLDAIIKRSER